MRLEDALHVLAHVHTRNDYELGFRVEAPPNSRYPYSAPEYVGAWEAVRAHIGLPTEPEDHARFYPPVPTLRARLHEAEACLKATQSELSSTIESYHALEARVQELEKAMETVREYFADRIDTQFYPDSPFMQQLEAIDTVLARATTKETGDG